MKSASSVTTVLFFIWSFRTSLAFSVGSKSSLTFNALFCSLDGHKQTSNNKECKTILQQSKLGDDSRQCKYRRRDFLSSMATTSVLFSFLIPKDPAQAAYGDSSSIELPSYIDFLIEKNKVVDSSSFLYQGPDREILITRIGEAAIRLKSIPILIEQKKWSQIQGVLTGPLGTLVQTMNQISGSSPKKEILAAGKKVKGDLFDISQAASKKNGSICLKAVAACESDLEAFVKLAF